MVFISSTFLFQTFNPRNPYSSTRLFHNLTNFNFSSNVSVIPDVGKSDLITFGNTEAFQTLSTSDLANCKRLGQTFFCEGRSIFQTNQEIVNSWLDWTMSLSQLFNHDDYDQLTAMITDFRKHVNGDSASQLLQRLDTVQKPFSADHWRFSSPAVMFGERLFS
jgi:hypothetical protein